jgi:hypothetical protein
MVNEKKDDAIILCEFIERKVNECRLLGEKYSGTELDIR